MEGVGVKATVDTGSQVTTLSESWYRRHLSAGKKPNPNVRWLRLSAANGQPIDSIGYLLVDIVVRGEVIPECPVIIIKSSAPDHLQPDCLLGMNVIQRLHDCPRWLRGRTEAVLPTLGNTVHAPRTSTWIPAQTVQHITVTAGDPTMSLDVVLEPPDSAPLLGGLSVLATYTKLHQGQLRIPVINDTNDDLLLPARAALGRVFAARPVEQPTIHLLTSESFGTAPGDTSSPLQGRPSQTTAKPGESVTGRAAKSPIPDLEEKLNTLQIDPGLTPSQHARLKDVLRRHADCFAWSDSELGYTDQVRHEIILTDDTPISQPYRRIPPAHLNDVKAHLQDLLARGIIAPSSSPYAAPVVVVRKKNGDIRLCVDYRRLNAVTRKDSFPLPRIDESLDALGGAKFFSTLDLASGYYQVAMAEKDKEKTAFVTPFGLYQFNRMSFGLTNAPSTFQRLMNSTMSDFIFSLLLVYLDDLLVYTGTFDAHLEALEKVLARLRSIGVRLNPEKCLFAFLSVIFLGHRVSAEGVHTNPKTVEAVRNWAEPSTAQQVRRFLGLASYYRRFVRGFSKIARPLHALYSQVHEAYPNDRHKGETKPLGDLWTKECQEAFLQLKMALTTAPVLGHPDYSLPFIVEVDSSFEGLGAVLSQRQSDGLKVIAYASRTLRMTEKEMKNYSSAKLELLGLKWAVTEKFRSHLLCHAFDVYTDNNPLAHLQTAKYGAVEQRWIAEITSVGDMRTFYKSGRKNTNADALSRQPVEEPEGPGDQYIAVSAVHSTAEPSMCFSPPDALVEEVFCRQASATPVAETSGLSELDQRQMIAAQRKDPGTATIIPFVDIQRRPTTVENRQFCDDARKLSKVFSSLVMQEGLLMRRWTEPGTREVLLIPVIPADRRRELFCMAHDQHGHQGAERTYQILRRRCYWPGLLEDVTVWVRQCARCQPAKRAAIPIFQPPGHLTASQPLEILALDYLTLDEASDGTEHVLTMTDVFTKFAVAVPTRDQTAATVVKSLIQRWILHYGVPLRIHSDQGKAFEAEVVQLLCKHYGIQKTRSSAYHAPGNGQCERFNLSLITLLSTLEPGQKRQWPKLVPELTYLYNCTPHSTTGLSPYALMFGREPRLPIDMALGTRPARSRGEEQLSQHLERLEALRHRAREKTRDAAAAREPPTPHRSVTIQVGDQVWLRQHPIGRHKLADKYGPTPATVLRVPGDSHGSFTIQFPDGTRKERHGSQLKKCHTPPAPPQQPAAIAPRDIPSPRPESPPPPSTRYTFYELVKAPFQLFMPPPPPVAPMVQPPAEVQPLAPGQMPPPAPVRRSARSPREPLRYGFCE